jgi:hypothetical protein
MTGEALMIRLYCDVCDVENQVSIERNLTEFVCSRCSSSNWVLSIGDRHRLYGPQHVNRRKLVTIELLRYLGVNPLPEIVEQDTLERILVDSYDRAQFELHFEMDAE